MINGCHSEALAEESYFCNSLDINNFMRCFTELALNEVNVFSMTNNGYDRSDYDDKSH